MFFQLVSERNSFNFSNESNEENEFVFYCLPFISASTICFYEFVEHLERVRTWNYFSLP